MSRQLNGNKRKFKPDEVVRINPKSGILNIGDICCMDELIYKEDEQQLLIGKTGVIGGISHHCSLSRNECYDLSLIDEEEHADEFLYWVLIDVENADELEDDEHDFCFRETDLESTGEFRENNSLSDTIIRVRVDPETGGGYLVDEEDWKKLEE